MSEPTDESQRQPMAEPQPPLAGASSSDVEGAANAPSDPPRADSVPPFSRKLAPPPKPKRDSQRPSSSSNPAPAPEAEASVPFGSLQPPPPPAIAFADAPQASASSISEALTGGTSLKAIEASLAAESADKFFSEPARSSRPPLPVRRASQPNIDPGAAEPSGDAPRATSPSQPSLAAEPSAAPRVASVPRPVRSDSPPSFPGVEPSSAVKLAPRAPGGEVAREASSTKSSLTPMRIIQVGASAPPPPVEPRSLPPEPASEVGPERSPEIAPPPPAVVARSSEPAIDPSLGGEDDTPALALPLTREIAPAVQAPTATPAAASAPAVTAGSAVSAPAVTAPSVETAEARAPAPGEERSPDSDDRIAVEELEREEPISIPPDEDPSPPTAPSSKAEPKQPPPPPRRAPSPPAAETGAEPERKRKTTKHRRAWWEDLFSEDFQRASWKLSDEQVRREVTFVEESLGVAAGGVVLDLGCGNGQHAVELASRGYGVVGYDLSLYQLALAADNAQERGQKINFLQGDMREMAFEEMFDGVFCWNTTFGYFEEEKNLAVAQRVFKALRPGGMFLVDVMNRDFVAAHTPSQVWFEGDSCVCMDDAVIDYFTSRLRVKRSVILDDGRTRECTYSVRLYSFHELGKLLHDVGFRVAEVSGHPATPGVFLGQASPRILMLAQRP